MRDRDVRRALPGAVEAHLRGAPHVLVPEIDIRWTVPARMDALLLSDRICGIEIKSDVDSLSRLPRQIEAYNAVSERAILVVGERLLTSASSLVPDWWAVWQARWRDGRVVITQSRRGRLNPDLNVNAIAMFALREDLVQALRTRGHHGLSALSVDQLRARLIADAGHKGTVDIVRSAMHARQDWRRRTLSPTPT